MYAPLVIFKKKASEENYDIPWKDGDTLRFSTVTCDYIRIFPAVRKGQSSGIYWSGYYISVIEIAAMAVLVGYALHLTNKAGKLKPNHEYSLLKVLRVKLRLLEWGLFVPCFEFFISQYNCENGALYADESYQCNTGAHFFHMALSGLSIFILVSVTSMSSWLFHEKAWISKDAFSGTENTHHLGLMLLKVFAAILTTFVVSESRSVSFFFCIYILEPAKKTQIRLH